MSDRDDLLSFLAAGLPFSQRWCGFIASEGVSERAAQLVRLAHIPRTEQ